VVLGPEAGHERIDQVVRSVLQHAGRVSYDLMHMICAGDKAIRTGIRFSPSVWSDIEAARAGGRGVMFCGAHLSNFNLAFLSFALNDLQLQLLSTPSRSEGFHLVGELRNRGMLLETPIDAASLRAAVRRLKEGGLVLTGADVPLASWDAETIPSSVSRPTCQPVTSGWPCKRTPACCL